MIFVGEDRGEERDDKGTVDLQEGRTQCGKVFDPIGIVPFYFQVFINIFSHYESEALIVLVGGNI